MTSGDDDSAQWAALEQEVAEYGDTPGISSEPSYTQEAGRQPAPEQYDTRRHGEPQQQYQQQQPQQQYSGVPDQEEDPIGHFSARANAVEGHLQHKEFWDNIITSENQFAGELEENEYQDAIDSLKEQRLAELYQQFPDTRETAVLAARHGFASPAHMRMYQLQQDAIAVARQAMANGRSPAMEYYALAVQRGHRPRTIMTKSFSKNVMKNLDKATPAEFDQFWELFKRSSKQV